MSADSRPRAVDPVVAESSRPKVEPAQPVERPVALVLGLRFLEGNRGLPQSPNATPGRRWVVSPASRETPWCSTGRLRL